MTDISDFIPITPLPENMDGYAKIASDRVLRHSSTIELRAGRSFWVAKVGQI